MLDELILLLVHIEQIPGFGRRKRFDLLKSQAWLAPETRSTTKNQRKKYYDTLLRPGKVQIPGSNFSFGTGWLPPIYDKRDYTEQHQEIKPIVEKLKIPQDATGEPALPSSVDWRSYCSAIENQGGLSACSAHAAAGIVEYFEKRTHEKMSMRHVSLFTKT